MYPGDILKYEKRNKWRKQREPALAKMIGF
jgi:hypothetical protein